jgi:hypothetical protein
MLWASGLAHRETVAVLPGSGFFIVCALELVGDLKAAVLRWLGELRARLAAEYPVVGECWYYPRSGKTRATSSDALRERKGRRQ